jgi:predicted nucleic acid-binding Zn ribbon protein
VSEPALTKCPSCGKESFRKLLSAAGFQLKGSGWYATDFKGSGKPAPAKGDAKPEAKADTKTDTKPDSGKSEKAATPVSSDN